MNLHLDQLNPQQREAVEHIDGPLLLLAGAGSGKTRVITHRIGYLVLKGIEPDNILAVSFTNKASREMAARVAQLAGTKIAERATLSTFHSLGAQILRDDTDKLGYRPRFTILDQGDQVGVVRSILHDLNIDPQQVDPRRVLFLVSRAKMAFTEPAKLSEFRFDPVMPFAQRVHGRYRDQLRALNAVDFDDLICLPVKLFREHEEIRQVYADRFQYIMVDEYQDTNHTQLLFVQEIAKGRNNVCVVGDDDQSIYAFRGAVSGNILQFEEQFPGARIIKLEQNYRSTNAILKAANAVIAHNPARKEKNLWSSKGDGEPVRLVVCADAREEAEYCAAEIDRVHREHDLAWSDFAVLFRSNPQSRLLEEACRTHSVPYRLVGSQEFFDRTEVKDVLAYLRVATNTGDEMALRRIVNVPSRGIGAKTLERMTARTTSDRTLFDVLCAVADGEVEIENMSYGAVEKLRLLVSALRKNNRRLGNPGELRVKADALLADLNFIDYLRSGDDPPIANRRIENVREFLESIDEWEDSGGESMEAFLTRITLDSQAPTKEESSNAVQLMTLHSSKGLEFPVVFLVGMEEDLLPHARALAEAGGVEEERRLCYVGITRAKKRLTLTRARKRKKFGTEIEPEPSRFLREIPEEFLQLGDAMESSGLSEKKKEMNLKYVRALTAMLE